MDEREREDAHTGRLARPITGTEDAVTPPDFAPESAQPAFSKGGHGAGEPAAEHPRFGERDLTEDERERRGDAQPPRR